jgi:hypothetical protein
MSAAWDDPIAKGVSAQHCGPDDPSLYAVRTAQRYDRRMKHEILTDEQILAKYRRLYPYLTEEQVAEVRDRNRRLLLLAFRQIDRLKSSSQWRPDAKQGDSRIQ